MGYAATQVTTLAAAWMNDAAQAVYTDAVLFPFLKSAYRDLQRILYRQTGFSGLRKEVVITLPATGTQILDGGTSPNAALPADYLLPVKLWEKGNGTSERYTMIRPVRELTDRDQTNQLLEWLDLDDKLQFIGSTRAVDVKLRYRLALAVGTVVADTTINIRDSQDALGLMTAAMAARSRGVTTLVNDLATAANDAIEMLVGSYLRQRTGRMVRRRPYGARRGAIYG